MDRRTSHLGAAKAAKNDEFYTQWADIEREMNAYLEYDPDVFRDKVILLPCDDPEWSNFTKFFALHFVDFGLKKLISTSYAPDSNPADDHYQPTLFETESPAFDATKTRANGKKFALEAEGHQRRRRHQHRRPPVGVPRGRRRLPQRRGDGAARRGRHRHHQPAVQPLPRVRRLARRGRQEVLDHRQPERRSPTRRSSRSSRRTSCGWARRLPAPTWCSAFRRLHVTTPIGSRPRGSAIRRTTNVTTRVPGNSCWFTNIDHGRRHEPLQLMTMADNIKFSKHKEVRGVGYQRYDNFDAIEVPFIDAIPSDYDGMMGVPITFLDKYNPDQFEIVGSSEGD